VGLMQVYPKIWLTKQMTDSLGKDLASDSTNVKYGVFILDRYFHPKTRSGATKDVSWATALLHYNGCVKGTNTPDCHRYPGRVLARAGRVRQEMLAAYAVAPASVESPRVLQLAER
jgi:hypothetical protein